mgnify:CR=1 FL=1
MRNVTPFKGWRSVGLVLLGWLLVLTALQLAQHEGWTVIAQIATVLAGIGAMALCGAVLPSRKPSFG